ncbi:MAG: hypothetical protein ABIH85_05590, partial [Candidatus Omnitrophota bacterium]
LSISPEESSSILSMSYEAFKDMKDVEVWIKPHPFLDLDKVFNLAGMQKEDSDFKIKEGALELFLPSALVAVTGESSAAVEALAFGCRVLIVNVPEWINLSPLRFLDTKMVPTVNSPEKLRSIVAGVVAKESYGNMDKEEQTRVVNRFFCLNENSNIPKKFLMELKGV